MATVQENLQCWFIYDATKPNVIENRICEGTDCLKAALSSGVRRLQFTVASAKSVSGGSNEAVTLLNLVTWASTLTYRMKTQNSRLTPLTRIFNYIVDSSLLPLLFLRCLSILSDCPVINIHRCHEDMNFYSIGPMAYHPHTGSDYSNLLTHLCHDYSSSSNISGMDLHGSAYRQMSNM